MTDRTFPWERVSGVIFPAKGYLCLRQTDCCPEFSRGNHNQCDGHNGKEGVLQEISYPLWAYLTISLVAGH